VEQEVAARAVAVDSTLVMAVVGKIRVAAVDPVAEMDPMVEMDPVEETDPMEEMDPMAEMDLTAEMDQVVVTDLMDPTIQIDQVVRDNRDAPLRDSNLIQTTVPSLYVV